MTTQPTILDHAAQLARSGQPFVLVTVIKTEGSTPRDVGAMMLWRPECALEGTVGGGEFEHLVVASCEDHFRNRSCGGEEFLLGRDTDQCCGGRMEVFFQYVGPHQRLVIFGAGHVALALVSALRMAALEIVIVDDRPDWNTAERFPGCRRVTEFDEGVALSREQSEATLACVMTCSHERDFELLQQLLPDPPGFLGLIGSKSKRVSFFTRLAGTGFDESEIRRIHCPIGLGDMGKEPELVAISIAGQVLLEAKKLGTL